MMKLNTNFKIEHLVIISTDRGRERQTEKERERKESESNQDREREKRLFICSWIVYSIMIFISDMNFDLFSPLSLLFFIILKPSFSITSLTASFLHYNIINVLMYF